MDSFQNYVHPAADKSDYAYHQRPFVKQLNLVENASSTDNREAEPEIEFDRQTIISKNSI